MHDRIAYQGITFDDVLLEPGLLRSAASPGRYQVATDRARSA